MNAMLDIIQNKSNHAKDLLEKQIFGQVMMENLINDLLDMAKLENNAF